MSEPVHTRKGGQAYHVLLKCQSRTYDHHRSLLPEVRWWVGTERRARGDGTHDNQVHNEKSCFSGPGRGDSESIDAVKGFAHAFKLVVMWPVTQVF